MSIIAILLINRQNMRNSSTTNLPAHPGEAELTDFDKNSKTQRKKAMHELQLLGEKLIQLEKAELEKMKLPEALQDAVLEAKKIKPKGGALRRQRQYIGKLMRKVDIVSIRAHLSNESRLSQQAWIHFLEKTRMKLLTEADAVTVLCSQYPHIDTTALQITIDKARQEYRTGQGGQYYRALFQLLKQYIPLTM